MAKLMTPSLIQRINNYKNEQLMTQLAFCKKVGISEPTYIRAKKTGKCSIGTIKKILDIIGKHEKAKEKTEAKEK